MKLSLLTLSIFIFSGLGFAQAVEPDTALVQAVKVVQAGQAKLQSTFSITENCEKAETQKFAPNIAIPNFHVVSKNSKGKPVILRGANPEDSGIEPLKALGVKTIIDLQGGDADAKFPRGSGIFNFAVKGFEPGERQEEIAEEKLKAESTPGAIRFLNFPLNSIQPVTAAEEAEISSILKEMSNPANQPVYVHCQHGHDRTGMIIALYRVKYEHMPVAQAYQEMLDMGHNPDDHVTESMDIYFYKATRGYP